ncbi:MAG TPA: SIMPL domain-containing protein [Roseiarcus sp.]
MSRKIAPIFVVLSFALAESAWAQQPSPPAPPTVSVVGVATEEARPDIVLASFEIFDQRPTAADAEGENARMTAAVLDGLKASGVAAKDIATVGLRLSPVWGEERDAKNNAIVKRTLTGYEASNTLSVTMRALDKVGALIAEAVQNGANYQGVAFDLSDREQREDALRIKAVANAIHRASLYAEGAQMKLGAVQSIGADGAEPAYRPAPRGKAMMTAAASPMPVEPGLISLAESVTATFALVSPQ